MASSHPSRGKRRLSVALVAVVSLALLGVVGAAYAFWTSSGIGTGSADTGVSVAFDITSDPAVGTIAPGSAGQTVDFTVTNPGPGTQSLTSVAVTMATAGGVPWVPTGNCLIADYTATVTTQPAAGVMAVGATRTGTATVTLANTGVNQDDCQGQTVPLYLVAS